MRLLARLLPLASLVPMLAFAAGSDGQLAPISTFIGGLMTFVNGTLVPAVFALSFIVFIWGVFKTFILGGHEEEKQAQGKQLMIYGMLGFVVMLSVWGIVNFLVTGFGFGGAATPTLPSLPTTR